MLNVITIYEMVDFNDIINSPIFITGNKNLQEQETAENMWAISFSPLILSKITLKDCMVFLDALLIKKREQIKQMDITCPVIFYMWFDEMAAQLRFNIISEVHMQLPFGCQLKIVCDPEIIFKNFLSSDYRDAISWDELEISNNDDDYNEEDDEQVFALEVFVKNIN